jgi:hypothetical protein
MAAEVQVHSDDSGGVVRTITLTQTAADAARIDIETSASPGSKQSYDLKIVTADVLSAVIVCKIDEFPWGDLRLAAPSAANGQPPVATITLSHAFLGNGTYLYPLRAGEDAKVRAFLQQANFPSPAMTSAAVSLALAGGGSPLAQVVSRDVAAPSDESEPEEAAFGRTWYVRYDLAIPSISKQTAIFWPSGFVADAHVDVIFYLHGWRVDDNPPRTMKEYFQRPYGGLREALNASGQNAVLVAPTLGDHSESGRLSQPGQLDALLATALTATRRAFVSDTPTEMALRNLYFAAHSGGGKPMRLLAGGAEHALANLQECWSFDAATNSEDETFWPGWAMSRSADLGYFYYRENDALQLSVKAHTKAIREAGRANLIVMASRTSDHMFVPVVHLEDRARHARGLEPKATFTS